MAKYGDNFSRPDSDSLGSPWVESEQVAGVLRVKNNKLNMRPVIGGVGRGGWARFAESYGDDHSIRVRCQVLDAWYYLVVRGSGTHTNFTGYVCVLDVFGFFPWIFDLIKLTNFNWETGNPFVDGVILAEDDQVVVADGFMELSVVGTRITARILDPLRPEVEWSRLQVTDTAIAAGDAGVAVPADAAAGTVETDFDDVIVEDVVATTWTINDVAPIPLSQTFEAVPAESDVVPFDIAPFELLHDFVTPPAASEQPLDIAPFELIMAFGGGPADQNITADQPITSQEAFGAARVDYDVQPSGVPTAEAFGTLRVDHDVEPTAISTAETFGAARVDQDVQPAGIASAEAFGTPDLTIQVLEPGGIPSAEAFGSARIDQDVAPTGVPSAEAFGAPSMSLDVSPTGIPSGEVFGAARVDYDVQPSGVPSGEAFGTALVALEQQILVSAIPSAEAFGALSVGVGGELLLPDRALLETGTIDIDLLPDREGLESDARGEIVTGARDNMAADTLEVSVLPTRKRLKLGGRLL